MYSFAIICSEFINNEVAWNEPCDEKELEGFYICINKDGKIVRANWANRNAAKNGPELTLRGFNFFTHFYTIFYLKCKITLRFYAIFRNHSKSTKFLQDIAISSTTYASRGDTPKFGYNFNAPFQFPFPFHSILIYIYLLVSNCT